MLRVGRPVLAIVGNAARLDFKDSESAVWRSRLQTSAPLLTRAAQAVGRIEVTGLPGYTFERAAGELWRSRFDTERNLIVVNSGHRDFVFATRSRTLQLRYLVRLYVKELVLRNFAGMSTEQVAERMIELSLYVEDKLKPM